MKFPEEKIAGLLRDLASGRGQGNAPPGSFILIGLVGRGIQSSRSPAMHEREAARLGLRFSYVLIDFDRLDLPDAALGSVFGTAERIGFAGLNVTHPFKQAVIPHLTALAPQAAAIGAVNTVVFRDGSCTGHNTDARGFAESFAEGMAGCPLARVVQFGAGGAGAAVAHALLDLGVGDLAIVDSAPGKAQALAETLAPRFGSRVRATQAVRDVLAKADGIVNASPIGMAKYPGLPFPADLLRPRHWVAEIVYFPRETDLLRQARSLGCRTLAGTGMAVLQAVHAFALFTGVAPDREAMARHLETVA